MILKDLIIEYVCPNLDGFHGEETYVEYLLIPNFKLGLLEQKDKDDYSTLWSFRVYPCPGGFIFIDEPADALRTALEQAMPNSEVLKVTRVCGHCRKKGVRGSKHFDTS